MSTYRPLPEQCKPERLTTEWVAYWSDGRYRSELPLALAREMVAAGKAFTVANSAIHEFHDWMKEKETP